MITPIPEDVVRGFCMHCGLNDSLVDKTNKFRVTRINGKRLEVIERRRVCKACGHAFVTHEMAVSTVTPRCRPLRTLGTRSK